MEATPKITEIPWEHDEGEITASGAVIAQVYSAEDFPCLDPDEHDIEAVSAEFHAVGQLIAMAPTLLAHIKEAVEHCEQCRHVGLPDVRCARCQTFTKDIAAVESNS